MAPGVTRFLSSQIFADAGTARSRSRRRWRRHRTIHVPDPRRRLVVRVADGGHPGLAGRQRWFFISDDVAGSGEGLTDVSSPSPRSRAGPPARSPPTCLWRTPSAFGSGPTGEKPSAADSLGVVGVPDEVHRRDSCADRSPGSVAPGWRSRSGPTTRTRSPAEASRAWPR